MGDPSATHGELSSKQPALPWCHGAPSSDTRDKCIHIWQGRRQAAGQGCSQPSWFLIQSRYNFQGAFFTTFQCVTGTSKLQNSHACFHPAAVVRRAVHNGDEKRQARLQLCTGATGVTMNE